MQEEMQTEDEISLSDIFRALCSKIWIIIASLLAGVILGGVFGFVKYHDVHYYGADVEYYVSSTGNDSSSTIDPEGIKIYQSYQENILKQIQIQLSSERFTRILLKELSETEGIEFDSDDIEMQKKYDKLLKTVNDSLSYSYEAGVNVIRVRVSVLNDPKLAEHLLNRVTAEVPDFVVDLLGTSQFGATQCTPMNFPRNDLLNEGQTTKEMIKFGLIIGLVAAIVACVAVVVTDRTDTRLRDYEDIPRKFNLPVLGVVPRIETLVQEDKTNNKNIRKGAEK